MPSSALCTMSSTAGSSPPAAAEMSSSSPTSRSVVVMTWGRASVWTRLNAQGRRVRSRVDTVDVGEVGTSIVRTTARVPLARADQLID